jgi:hypothetical protein
LAAYPQYSGVNAFRKPQANSNYQSGIVSAEHRYRNGFTTLISFTGSKLIDDASQVVSYIGQAGTKQDFYCRKCEKSVSSQDVPRRLNANATRNTVGRNRSTSAAWGEEWTRFRRWQINGITTFRGILSPQQWRNSANIGAPGTRATDNGQDRPCGGSIKSR